MEMKPNKIGIAKNNNKQDPSNSLCNNQCQGGDPGQCQFNQGSEVKVNVKEGPINYLPPEMLTGILKCVDTPTLFKCRLMNSKWSEICIWIVTKRTDNVTVLYFNVQSDGKVRRLLMDRAGKLRDNSLGSFVKCMKSSNCSNCPFVRFNFSIYDLSFFDLEEWIDFVSYFEFDPSKQKRNQNQNHGNRIKSLHLEFFLDDADSLMEKLRDLLLNKIPYLEEFELDIRHDEQDFRLFPPSPAPVQLPNLKRLNIYRMMQDFPEVVQDLFNAASNLTSLGILVKNPEDFQLFHSLGKLHLVKEAIIQTESQFFSNVKNEKECALLPLPKLKVLDLVASTRYFEPQETETNLKVLTFLLTNLFETSKDTLTELQIHPLGFLPKIKFPIYKNLRDLYFFHEPVYVGNSIGPFFPPGIDKLNIFPAVSDLEFDMKNWSAAFPSDDCIPRLLNVKTLVLDDMEIDAHVISILAVMCPNLKKFQIQKEDNVAPQLNFAQVVEAVKTHLKGVEQVELDVDLDKPENNSAAFDSLFTGISKQNFGLLYEMIKTGQIQENGKFRAKIDAYELTKGVKVIKIPYTSSMKDLKTFTINPYSGEKLLVRKIVLRMNDENLSKFKSTISWSRGSNQTKQNEK